MPTAHYSVLGMDAVKATLGDRDSTLSDFSGPAPACVNCLLHPLPLCLYAPQRGWKVA